MKQIRPADHSCPLPNMIGNGEILQCKECGTYWQGHTYANYHYNCWRKIGWLARLRLGLR